MSTPAPQKEQFLVINALGGQTTTLVTTLALEQGYPVQEAEQRVRDILGLPAVDLLSFDPIALTAAGEAEGPAVLSGHMKKAQPASASRFALDMR